jgi:hypothetical protein
MILKNFTKTSSVNKRDDCLSLTTISENKDDKDKKDKINKDIIKLMVKIIYKLFSIILFHIYFFLIKNLKFKVTLKNNLLINLNSSRAKKNVINFKIN